MTTPATSLRTHAWPVGVLAAWRHACWGAWLLSLSLFLGLAHAEGPNEGGLRQAYWEDASGQADFAHARTQVYTPYQGLLSRGYTPAAIWVRLVIPPPPDLAPGERIVLRIHPNYLDQITLYDPLAPEVEPQQAGDRADPSLQAIASIDFAFVLAPTPGTAREVYLRLQTTSSAMMLIEVMGESRFHVREHEAQLKAYGALALLVLLWAIVFSHWLQDRDLLTALFLLRPVIYGAGAVLSLGLGRALLFPWVPPALLDQAFNHLTLLGTLVSIVFEIRLLQEWGMKPWARRGGQGLCLLASCVLGCLWFGQTRLALMLNAQLVILTPVLLLLISLFGLRETHSQMHGFQALLSRKLLIAYYSSLFVLLMAGVLPLLGFGAAGELSCNIALVYSLFSCVLLAGLLHQRAVLMRQRLHAIGLDAALLRQQADTERHHREAQSRWLRLLMHEIKNPLAAIEAAQHRANLGNEALVSKNVAAIRHVLDRSLSLDKLEAGQLQTVRQPCLLTDCLSEVIDENEIDEKRLDLLNLRDDLVITTDQACLHILLGNLLSNAFKYGDPHAPVRFEVLREARGTDAPQPWVGIAIGNRPGFSGWPDPAQVFEKYYRANATQNTPGTGMGLYLVQQLALLLGGECHYRPTSEHVRFELWLPA